ncbi:MAG TPA: glycosyltransferase family 1 protein [Candidatus Saccharimonadales bacterium]|nr:glycosyltransferase family 1 protein [Candidatus Saccharimonadales bacterium]
MDKIKHVVIDARPISSSGYGTYLRGLLENLGKIDTATRYTVLVWPDYDRKSLKLPANFSLQKANYPINGSLKEQFNLAWRLYRLKPDLVHFAITQQPLLYFGKSITTVHDLTALRFSNPSENFLKFKFKQLMFGFMLFWIGHKSKILITPSDYVRQDVARFAKINPKKILVTYEAATNYKDKPKKVAGLVGQKFVMYVGRPNPHKNLERLIEAMQIVQASHPELKLVLAGKNDKNYEKIKKLTQENNLTSQVIFTDFVSDGQLVWLYKNALGYVFPSLSEGFGLPGLEAMSYSLPVASSNASCLPEIYKDAALYFNPEDTKGIASKIIQLASSPGLRKDLIHKGLVLAKTYSWQKTAEQTLDIYKKVLG